MKFLDVKENINGLRAIFDDRYDRCVEYSFGVGEITNVNKISLH